MTTQDQSNIHRALSNPDRIAIMEYLAAHGRASVADVAAAINRSQTHTTQHLIKMGKAGLIDRKQERQTVWNSIAGDVVWPIVVRK